MKNFIKLAVLPLLGAALLAGCGKQPGPREHLSAVRSALQVYYGDNEGKFPDTLAELTKNGKYLLELPKVDLPGHRASNAVKYISGPTLSPKNLTDEGGYAYYNSDKYPDTKGAVVLNCTHANKKGAPVHSY